MKEQPAHYHIVDLSPARREIPNFLNLFWWRHIIYGLLEVDVTTVRHFIQEHKERTGEALSFNGYLAFCLAHAVDEDKSIQGFLKGNRRLVVFDDVDVAIPIERRVDGTRVPTSHIIRGANNKAFREINREIRWVQSQPVAANKGFAPWLRSGMLLPGPLSTLFVVLVRAANRLKPAITASVAVFGDQILPREILHLTIGFDHDVVDGAPAARFVQRLTELIESGYGLLETELTVPASVAVPA